MLKNKSLLLLILFFVVNEQWYAQTNFCQRLGTSKLNGFQSMVATSDGGMVLVGESDTLGISNRMSYVIKTDGSGNIQWSKNIFGGATMDVRSNSVAQTSDGGIVVTGQFDMDVHVYKLDINGNLLWNNKYNYSFGTKPGIYISPTSDGGSIVLASDAGSPYVIKLDNLGIVQWSETINEPGFLQLGFAIKQTKDRGYIIGGWSSVFSAWGNDGYLVKLDSMGVMQWAKEVGNTTMLSFNDIIQTSDGGYAGVGQIDLFQSGDMDFALSKFDSLGNQQWTSALRNNNWDIAYNLFQTPGNDYIIAGQDGNYEAVIIKINSAGQFSWANRFTGSGYSVEGISVVPLAGGSIGFGGRCYPGSQPADFFQARTSPTGTNCCTLPVTYNDTLFVLPTVPVSSVTPVTTTVSISGTLSAGASKTVLCTYCGGLTASISPTTPTVCVGNSITLNSSVSGGILPYTYTWVPGGFNTSSITINPSVTKNYTLFVASSSSTCTVNDIVKVQTGPLDSISSSKFICPAYSTVLQCYGSGTYSWSTGSTASSITVAPASNTIYSVNVNGAYGCIHNYSVQVTVGPCSVPASFCSDLSISSGDWAYGIISTSDGGYLLSGQTTTGSNNMGIVKTDPAGNIVWSYDFGDACAGCNDLLYDVIETTSGKYVGTGQYKVGSKHHVYLICFDKIGNILWRNSYNYFNGLATVSLVQANDKGFLVGSDDLTSGNFVLHKTDSVGTLQWVKTFTVNGCVSGGSDVQKIIKAAGGGYFLGGSTSCFGSGNADFLLTKIDSLGNDLWHRTIGGSNEEICYDIIQASDGSIYMSGMTKSFGAGGGDLYLVKMSNTGNLIWTRTIGYNVWNQDDYGMCLAEGALGSVIVGGTYYDLPTAATDAWVIKFNSAGNLIWNKKITGPYDLNVVNAITTTKDGGFAVGGIYKRTSTDYNFLFSKLDSLGYSCCTFPGGGTLSSGGASLNTGVFNLISSFSPTVMPLTISPGGFYKQNICGATALNENPGFISESGISVFPNPVSNELFIEGKEMTAVYIYNELGQNIAGINNSKYEEHLSLNTCDLKPGIYFIRIISNDRIYSAKIIKQ